MLSTAKKIYRKSLLIFRIPSVRESVSKIRFRMYKKRLRTEKLVDGVLHLEYSKSHLVTYESIEARINLLVNTLETSSANRNGKLLSIGARFESELFGYMSLGYQPSSIDAIDIFSYSAMIEPGNMHHIDFADDTFDVVIAGWVLYYSSNMKLALSEMRRVLKPGGKLILGFSIHDNYEVDFFDLRNLPIMSSVNSDTSGGTVERFAVKDLIDDCRIESINVGRFAWTEKTNVLVCVLSK